MNKIYRFMVVTFLMSIVSLSLFVTSAQALDPRCDSEIWDIQLTHAEAMLVKDTALTAELIPQNDSVLAMTCFDQAMIMSARAGEIFSDVETPASFASLTSIATGLGNIVGYDPATGSRGGTLMDDLNSTITDVLKDLMDDFIGAITSVVAGAVGSAISSLFGGAIGGLFGAISGLLSSFSFKCEFMQQVWDDNVIGEGITSDTSFLSNDELFDYAASRAGIVGVVAPPIAGSMVPEFKKKLDNPDNANVLVKAWEDLNLRLVPGGIGVYKTPPAIGVDSDLATVLGAM